MKTNTLSLSGLSYHYQIKRKNSKKSPILFINGAFQNMYSWTALVDFFSPDHTTIIADLPGWGSADMLPAHFNFDYYAEAIEKILEHEEVDKVSIISTSYGTPLALAMAKKYKKRIKNLILTAPILEINPKLLELYPRFEAMIDKNQVDQLSNFLIEIGLLNQKQGRAGRIEKYAFVEACFHRQVMKLTPKKIQSFFQNTQRLIKHSVNVDSSIMDIPTYVLTGEHDSFTLPANCLNIACKFNQFQFDTISNADHFFLFEQATETATMIGEFLNRSEEGRLSKRA